MIVGHGLQPRGPASDRKAWAGTDNRKTPGPQGSSSRLHRKSWSLQASPTSLHHANNSPHLPSDRHDARSCGHCLPTEHPRVRVGSRKIGQPWRTSAVGTGSHLRDSPRAQETPQVTSRAGVTSFAHTNKSTTELRALAVYPLPHSTKPVLFSK